MSYRFHRAAEAEHLEQIGYYDSRRPGLGARCREHFYRERNAMIQVLAIAHHRPRLGYWLGRAR
jgi:hypothetical protein